MTVRARPVPATASHAIERLRSPRVIAAIGERTVQARAGGKVSAGNQRRHDRILRRAHLLASRLRASGTLRNVSKTLQLLFQVVPMAEFPQTRALNGELIGQILAIAMAILAANGLAGQARAFGLGSLDSVTDGIKNSKLKKDHAADQEAADKPVEPTQVNDPVQPHAPPAAAIRQISG